MNKLPSIYLDKINENRQHNKKVCYIKNSDNIEESIKEIFKGQEPMYMIKVLVQTSTNMYETRIYEIREKEIITIDHIRIPIENIINIKRIS